MPRLEFIYFMAKSETWHNQLLLRHGCPIPDWDIKYNELCIIVERILRHGMI
jgi:hypothetical protein